MDASAYLSQLIGLLPPGDALVREPGSVLQRLLSVPAAELARVDGRVEALLTESDPARTAEMLADWERALGLPDVCYPNFQFSRASRGWYFDGAGVLREAAVDEPRNLYDTLGRITDAVVVEAVATNFVANARLGGTAVGTPGTLPTGLTASGGALAVAEVTFAGTEDGLPCAELRIAGTLAAATDLDIAFTTTTATPAVVADVFTGSFFWRLITGTAPTNWRMRFEEFSSGGALLVGNQVDLAAATAAALRGQRVSSAYTVGSASAAFLRHVARLRFAAGAVNTTLRLAVPQLERGAVATSPILNPIGAPAATTRAADQLYIATVRERRERILARLIERFEPTPAAIIGLAARLGDTVTLTEFRPHSCEDSCEAAVADEPWAHAFQVAGGAQQVVEFTCEDTSETPLSQWRTGRYECAIRRFAPAHTLPIFSYAGGGGGGDGIVTSGRVAEWDALNPASYPGTGTTLNDISGNGNHLTAFNSPTWNAGGWFATGATGYFSRATGIAMPQGNDPYTLQAWVRFSSWSALGGIMSIGGYGASNQSNALRTGGSLGGGGVGRFLHYWWANDLEADNNNASLSLNTWFMITANFDGTTRRLFANTTEVASDTPGSGHNVTSSTIQLALTYTSSGEYLQGDVAIARIYNRALPASEVDTNFNADCGRFGL
ncbi:MAG: DUF2313 domain-containing protein [Acetobacteraceae bacterium]|jgi:uncharacterized protein YmfQ (DUF2313 family)|nr:DUF2313 domain-containing protein [Acetobacteraceae bacterium]